MIEYRKTLQNKSQEELEKWYDLYTNLLNKYMEALNSNDVEKIELFKHEVESAKKNWIILRQMRLKESKEGKDVREMEV